MSAEGGEPKKCTEKKTRKPVMTCGDSVQQETEHEKRDTDVQLGLGDDAKHEDDDDELDKPEDWETYLDTVTTLAKVGLMDDESDKIEKEKTQQTIWDQLEPSEANLNKLDGCNKLLSKIDSNSSSSELIISDIDSLTIPENENGKRVRWADIEQRLQSQQGADMIARFSVETSL